MTAIKAFASKHTPADLTKQFKLADHVGVLVGFTVTSVENIETKFGAKDAIRADVTIMDGLLKGMDYSDQLLFAASVVRDLRDEIGNVVVARVGEWNNGTNSGYELRAPSAEDLTAAAEFYPGF